MERYLQVEAVNIYSAIADTNQLSIIRGGSLLLKQAIVNIKKRFKQSVILISSGASSGLFQLKNGVPDAIATDIADFLNGNNSTTSSDKVDPDPKVYQHFTFTVNTISQNSIKNALLKKDCKLQSMPAFTMVKEALIAKQRFQQLQQSTFAYSKADRENADKPCAANGIKPATMKEHIRPIDDKPQYYSKATWDRFDYGRKLRSSLYYKECADIDSYDPETCSELVRSFINKINNSNSNSNSNNDNDNNLTIYEMLKKELTIAFKNADKEEKVNKKVKVNKVSDNQKNDKQSDKNKKVVQKGLLFTNSIHEIAEDPAYPQLNNKIAVLYFDGNGFGGIQRESINNQQQQKDFDQYVQQQRRIVLTYILCQCLQDKERKRGVNGKKQGFYDIDYETETKRLRLETLLWGGDEVLFVVPAWMGFKLLGWFYEATSHWQFGGYNMSHAGGLVFCHYKTPIDKMRQLAQELADRIKEKEGGRDDNHFDYIVLESVDYPTESLDSYFKKRYGKLAASRSYLHGLLESKKSSQNDKKQSATTLSWNNAHVEISNLLHDHLPKSQIYQLTKLAPTALDSSPLKLCKKIATDISQEKLKSLSAFHLQSLRFCQLISEETLQKIQQHIYPLFRIHDESTELEYAWMWIQLTELWDYLAPKRSDDYQSSCHNH